MGNSKTGTIRTFESGATRDTDEGKLDYEGFLSPLVVERYAQYMHKHRMQSDGRLRASDNWQRGIDTTAYIKSLYRHFLDLQLHHRGYSELAREPKQEALCAIIFNAMGMLYESLKESL